MVTNRVTKTIPAAGVFIEIPIAARAVYVEAVRDSAGDNITSPADVPTIHAENRDDDGIPIYPRLMAYFREPVHRFFLEGSAAAEGGEVLLFFGEDPCVVLGFMECEEPAGEPLIEPTGTPTHVLAVNSSGAFLSVYDNVGTLVRHILSSRDNIGTIFVDYVPNWIYFGSRNASDEVILSRINFDGTGETVLANFGVFGAAQDVHVTRDESLGKFYVACSSRIFECDYDGSNIRTVNTVNVQWQGIAQGGNGAHLFAIGSSSLVKYTISTGSEVDHDTLGNGKIVSDPVSSRVFIHTGTGDKVQESTYNPNTGNDNRSDFLVTDVATGTTTGIYIYLRWLYFSYSNAVVQRVHLDDESKTVEEIATGLSSPSFIAPWWES